MIVAMHTAHVNSSVEFSSFYRHLRKGGYVQHSLYSAHNLHHSIKTKNIYLRITPCSTEDSLLSKHVQHRAGRIDSKNMAILTHEKGCEYPDQITCPTKEAAQCSEQDSTPVYSCIVARQKILVVFVRKVVLSLVNSGSRGRNFKALFSKEAKAKVVLLMRVRGSFNIELHSAKW